MNFCNTCREFDHTGGNHVCPPEYEVQEADHHNFDDPEDHRIVYARDGEDAAEKYAEVSDSNGDYTIIRGSEATVRVRKVGTEEYETYAVSGEAVPQYSAHRIDK